MKLVYSLTAIAIILTSRVCAEPVTFKEAVDLVVHCLNSTEVDGAKLSEVFEVSGLHKVKVMDGSEPNPVVWRASLEDRKEGQETSVYFTKDSKRYHRILVIYQNRSVTLESYEEGPRSIPVDPTIAPNTK